MKNLVVLALLICSAASAQAQVLDRRLYQLPPYAELPVQMRQVQREDRYDRLRNEKGVVFEQFSYLSDTFRINAFIARPATVTGKLPVVVYLRPGVGEAAAIGLLSLHNFYEMQKFAAAGFVVVASQFRGTGGSQGKDEIGGADLQDVMSLSAVIAALPEADPSKVVMTGASRGGQMALQAVRTGFPARAVVTVGAPTDWGAMLERNPQQNGLVRDAWPDFDKRRDEHLRNRSAIHWVDDIKTPLLIFQGTHDEPVPAEHTIAFARELQRKNKIYELHVYQGDDHLVITNRDERIAKAIDWFKKYLAPSPVVSIVSRDYTFAMPRQIPAGRITFEMANQCRHAERRLRVPLHPDLFRRYRGASSLRSGSAGVHHHRGSGTGRAPERAQRRAA